MNQINTIEIYRYHNTWAFTDKSRGLVDEPFVAGMPEIIDMHIEDGHDKAIITFSKDDFPGAVPQLAKTREENGGAWYRILPSTDVEGWLCPALLKYFDTPPENIYFDVKSFS